MVKKASLSETKRVLIVILHKEEFSQRFSKTYPVAKRLFIKQLLDFKILDFTMTRKEVESQEKQVFVMTT